MKLSKKLMLLEEFADIKPDVAIDVKQDSIRTEIVSDVDTIIRDLEALAANLDKEHVTESELVNEGDLVGSLMSSELYMIPIILAGGAAAAGAGVGLGIFALIKNITQKKKLRKDYAKVDSVKMKVAEIEVGLSKLKGGDEKQQKKAEALKTKANIMSQKADDLDKTLDSKWEKYKDFLASLRSQTQINVAEIMLKGDLSPSQKERFEEQLKNAEESLENKVNAEKAAAEEAEAKLGPEDEQIAKLEEEKENLKKKLESSEDEAEKEQIQSAIDMANKRISELKGETPAKTDSEEKVDKTDSEEKVDKTDNSKEGQLKRIDALIKKAEESGDEAKLQKAKDLKAKIEAKESLFLKYTKHGSLLEAELISLEREFEML